MRHHVFQIGDQIKDYGNVWICFPELAATALPTVVHIVVVGSGLNDDSPVPKD
jgi:hypothetical protein